MKIVIGTKEYKALKDLSFSPDCDVVNDRLSIDEVTCRIVTDDKILVGQFATLADEAKDWFYGCVMYAEEEQTGIVSVRIQSEIAFLDRKRMKAKMYNGETLQSAIQGVFNRTGATVLFDLGQSTLNKTVSGYCPEQSARERLHELLFAYGLYCKTTFVDHPTIAKFDTTKVKTIPTGITYWRPKLSYDNYVTDVTVVSFSYRQGTPTSDDEYVEAGGNKYIVSRTEVTLHNEAAPEAVGTNEILYDSVGLINSTNVSNVVSLLANYYFTRQKVEFDIINNGEYYLGKKYTVTLNEDSDLVTGYAESFDYAFGNQAKSKVVMGACTISKADKLIVEYVSKENPKRKITSREFAFPAGSSYTITTEYVTAIFDNYWYCFRPEVAEISGVKQEGKEKITVGCYIALKKNKKTGVLTVVSVDTVDRVKQGSGSDAYYIAEIS